MGNNRHNNIYSAKRNWHTYYRRHNTITRKTAPLYVATMITILGIALGYNLGLAHQCKVIDLRADYTFTCNGRVIQGPNYPNKGVVQTWEFNKN